MGSPKQEISKDYIFNLIMPTASAAPAQPEPQPPAGVQAEPAGSLSSLQSRIQAAPSVVRLKPAKDLVLVNLMEALVTDRLDEAFEKFNCCRCDKCRRDAAALALNLLPPRYVVADPEELPGLLAACSTKEVSAALIKAILQVKNHPNH